MRSLATSAGSAAASARTRISLGPAIMLDVDLAEHEPFAAATYALPGPKILSTAGIDAVPCAIAATACAPPTRYRRETLSDVTRGERPDVHLAGALHAGRADVHVGTPATFAGIAVMSTDDG